MIAGRSHCPCAGAGARQDAALKLGAPRRLLDRRRERRFEERQRRDVRASLQDEQRWSPDDIRTALSDEALTAAVMQRYHVANAIKRTLGSRLGSLKQHARER